VSDLRTRHLVPQLAGASRIVYASTSGVYGDCGGALIDETRRVAPSTPRAWRRLDAEEQLRVHTQRSHQRLSIVRVPGIYSAQRLPRERLLNRTPTALAKEDVFTNHIHVDDLAQILEATLFHGRSQRIYHACDDSQLLMGEYFDQVADCLQLPRAPRLARPELLKSLSVAQASFMLESRRMTNQRIKHELGVRLIYPTVLHQLKYLRADSIQLAT
jgi:nucleoside-diphosphate-sugar epimerase